MTGRRTYIIIVATFLAGYFIAGLVQPGVLFADMRNIVYETLDAKITVVKNDIKALSMRVSAQESAAKTLDEKIGKLAQSIKTLVSIKSVDTNAAELKTQLTALKSEVESLKSAQAAQEQVINSLKKPAK